jgi:hypothetical protein
MQTTPTGQYSHCNGVEEVMPKTPPEEVLRIEVGELAELLRTNQGLANLRAALTTRHLRSEDVVLGGLIESEEETIYGVFVNRAGECTIFEILRDGQVVRWDRVEEPSSLASEYPAINVAVSIATTRAGPMLHERPVQRHTWRVPSEG